MNQFRVIKVRLAVRPAWLPLLGIALVLLAACAPAQPEPTAEPTAESGPRVVLTWQRDGGIAGFCDRLTVWSDGQVKAGTCRGVEMQRNLTTAQLAQLETWLGALKPLEFEESDPAVSDAMTIRVMLAGRGNARATQSERQAIQDFAVEVYYQTNPVKLAPTPTPEAFVPVPPEARAGDAARDALADLIGVPAGRIEVVRVGEAEWPDGCLGLRRPGEMCITVITPGFQVTLLADGHEYEVRTNADATMVRVEGSPGTPAP
jgi:hypothetical protein